MILVNLQCSSGQVYKQALRVEFPSCVKSRLVENNTPRNHAPPDPWRDNLSSHTCTSSSCVKARKYFSELDTALHLPVSGRGNFCARVSVARSPWSW